MTRADIEQRIMALKLDLADAVLLNEHKNVIDEIKEEINKLKSKLK